MKICSKCGETKDDDQFPPSSWCKECRAIYARAYRQAHRDEAAVQNRRRYEANRDRNLAASKAYRAAHREEVSAANKAYHQAHREEIAAGSRDYYMAHREELKAYARRRTAEVVALRPKAQYELMYEALKETEIS